MGQEENKINNLEKKEVKDTRVAAKDEELNKTVGGFGFQLAYSENEKNTGNGSVYGSAD